MRVTFSFTAQPNIEELCPYEIYKSSINFPDEAKLLIGYEERILKIAECVAYLSDATVYLTCKDIGANKQLIEVKHTREPQTAFHICRFVMAFRVSKNNFMSRNTSQTLKIFQPTYVDEIRVHRYSQLKRKKDKLDLSKNLIEMSHYTHQKPMTKEGQLYIEHIKMLDSQITVLLVSAPEAQFSQTYFHPFWYDTSVGSYFKKEYEKYEKEAKRKEKEAKKAKLNAKKPSPKTGAGRRYGAIPGKFMGVQMRSQLEIRFATEAQSRNIEWIYEEERLGEGQYLVDFHLPTKKAWVEVKGTFEPRDHYLLKEVEQVLAERGERLFVYTSGKPFMVKDGEFVKISRDDFWQMIG